MELIPRPQPVGIYPLPVAALLLPAVDDENAPHTLTQLLKHETAQYFPAEWAFYREALAGRIAEAVELLGHDSGPLAMYNRFVLQGGDKGEYRRLKRVAIGPLAVLADVAAFIHGLTDELPDPTTLDGELKAMAHLARATAFLEQEQAATAAQELETAVALSRELSPLFAAQLLGQLAACRKTISGETPERIVGDYQEALRLLGERKPDLITAELAFGLGTTCQELTDGRRGLLVEAVKAYQLALQSGLSETEQPELYALTNNNLGLVYLALPMTEVSDQLRMAVAVRSFREALKVFRPDTYPELWASAQLNLANSLQHLPSSHPQENLIQAVEIYEQLLPYRNKALDPVGYARVLANQANALAHLGIFAPALEKANEAYKIFHWHNETEAAAGVLDLAAEINQRIEARHHPVPAAMEG